MAKYSQQFKLEVVQNYLSNKNDDGFRKTANKYKLDRATIRQWVAIYQTLGEDGLKPQSHRITYSTEFKLKVALLHKDLKCKAPLIEPNLRRNLGKWST